MSGVSSTRSPATQASTPVVPGIVCIGAQRAGTTWLFDCLSEHPEVFIPDCKEIHFFRGWNGPAPCERLSVEAYYRFFEDWQGESAILDISPGLLAGRGAASAMHAVIPDCSLLVILRNPIARAHSHYRLVSQRAHVDYTLAELAADPQRDDPHEILDEGFYARHLQSYLDLYGRERCLILLYEDLVADRHGFLKKILEFIGVDAEFVPPSLESKPNAPQRHRIRKLYELSDRVGGLLAFHGLHSVRRLIRATGLPALVRRLNVGDAEPSELDADTRRRLADLYRDDIRQLSGLIGRDLDQWLSDDSALTPVRRGTFPVTMVVPLRNEAATVGELIASIQQQTRQPEQVILVDGGSDDDTRATVRELVRDDARFRLVEAGPALPGRGRNIGIEAAETDWIALTDGGIRLEADWLEQLVRSAAEHPQAEVIYGSYDPQVNSLFERCAALAYVAPRRSRGGLPMRGPSTASMMLRREAWEKAGGFPNLRAAEDHLFFQQVQECGMRTAWAPRAVVHWQLQPSLIATFRRFARYSRVNAQAGLQAAWHYGIARTWLVLTVLLLLTLLHSGWWAVPLAITFMGRVARRIWNHRAQFGAATVLNPLVLTGVSAVMLTVDLATFAGWAQAVLRRGNRDEE